MNKIFKTQKYLSIASGLIVGAYVAFGLFNIWNLFGWNIAGLFTQADTCLKLADAHIVSSCGDDLTNQFELSWNMMLATIVAVPLYAVVAAFILIYGKIKNKNAQK